jgi:hypothetical protein
MWLIPDRQQWRRWSLPNRLTAIGAYAGVVALLITVALLPVWHVADSTREEGYIHNSSARPTSDPAIYEAIESLTLRDAPDFNSREISAIPKGTRLRILDTYAAWLHVRVEQPRKEGK